MGTGRSECPDVAELQHVLGQLVVADDYVAADVEPQVAGRPLEVEWDDESFVAVAVQANDPDAGWVDL